MKRIITLFILFCHSIILFSQGFNADKTALGGFLTRMFKAAPYDVKVVSDYNDNYLVSAVELDPAKYGGNESTMLRVASVKAMSQASRYFNGSNISSDILITTSENSDGKNNTEVIERIKENSAGYVKQLEFLSSFQKDDNHKVFLYIKKIGDD